VGAAVGWVWDKVTGLKDKPPEPGGINIDIEDHEEVTMRSTWVEHEDPPPPPPPAEHPTERDHKP
jgi:hypothetical protein